MTYKNAREKLQDNLDEIDEDMILIEEEMFVNSLIGVSSDLRAVYSYDLMLKEYMEKTGCEIDDAIDYVDAGVVRWLDYLPENRPVIVDFFGLG